MLQENTDQFNIHIVILAIITDLFLQVYLRSLVILFGDLVPLQYLNLAVSLVIVIL